MTIAQFPSEFGQRLLDLINDNATALLTDPDTGDVGQTFYGDQSRIGVTPTLCVETGTVNRTLAGIGGPGGRTENSLQAFIIIYYAKVDTNQITKLAAEQCAEGVVRYLDGNTRLERNNDGGIVIHGYVSSIEPGYVYRNQGNTLFHTVRLTWTGTSKTILGA